MATEKKNEPVKTKKAAEVKKAVKPAKKAAKKALKPEDAYKAKVTGKALTETAKPEDEKEEPVKEVKTEAAAETAEVKSEEKEEEKAAPGSDAKEASDVDVLLAAGDEKTGSEDEKHLDVLENAAKDSDLAAAAEAELKAKEASQSEMNKNIYVPLKAPVFEGDECEKAVEEKRNAFQVGMKSSRKVSTITMIVLVVFLIGGFVAYNYLPSNLKWIVYVIFGLLVVVMICSAVYASHSRKKLYGDVNAYVHDALLTTDSYVFTKPDLLNPVVSKSGHIDLSMLVEAHYFDTINGVNSRNIIRAGYYGKELTCSEIACRVPYQVPADGKDHSKDNPKGTPKDSYGIFGKYLTYPVKLPSGDSVIVLLKGANAYIPTYTDGYTEQKVEGLKEDYLVWTTSDAAKDEFFTPANIALLNEFVSDENLENIFVSVNNSGTKFALNYNETVMEVPMEKPVKGTPYLHYKNDVSRVLAIFKNLLSGESAKK